jgi:hypothetical protein
LANRRIAGKYEKNVFITAASLLTCEKSRAITAVNVLLIKVFTDGFFLLALFAGIFDVYLWMEN